MPEQSMLSASRLWAVGLLALAAVGWLLWKRTRPPLHVTGTITCGTYFWDNFDESGEIVDGGIGISLWLHGTIKWLSPELQPVTLWLQVRGDGGTLWEKRLPLEPQPGQRTLPLDAELGTPRAPLDTCEGLRYDIRFLAPSGESLPYSGGFRAP